MNRSGSLEDLGVAELLYVVALSRRSGLLRVEGRWGEHEILFRSGAVIGISSPKSPGNALELLVRRKAVDATHAQVLARQASQSGTSLSQLLAEENIVSPAAFESQLRAEVTEQLRNALKHDEGRFDFELHSVPDQLSDRFGGLILGKGVDPASLQEVTERTGRGPLGGSLRLPSSDLAGGRQVEMLTPVSEITLPDIRQAAGATVRVEASPITVLCTVDSLDLARALREELEDRHLRVQVARDASEASRRLHRALEAGPAPYVVGDAAHPALPGLELLALGKALDRSVRGLVLLDPRSTASQQAAVRDRAFRLGANHVVLGEVAQPPAELAAALAELVMDTVPVRTKEEAPLEWDPNTHSGTLPVTWEPERLSRLARSLAASTELGEVGLALLEVAARQLPRGLLLTRSGNDFTACGGFGWCRPAGERHAALVRDAPTGELSARLREGERYPDAARDPQGQALLEALGGEARESMALPLRVGEKTIGGLYLDDGGLSTGLPDLEDLERFLAEASVSLGRTLEADRRRIRARELRRQASL